ncbi:hypothetical protein ACFVFJ_49150 [Streptomyces sp. NPDC057717]|uniref:hypothetical protein n=1 Tax=Streptomyces sp. NPDC057717 TaxID=3346224 RepID=UPI0036C034C3
MPTSNPGRSRKRTREIREQSQAAGAKYTAAMLTNDQSRAGEFEPERPTYRYVDRLNRGWRVTTSAQPAR